MAITRKNIVLASSGLATAFAFAMATGLVQEKKPMTITQCENVAETGYSQLRARFGYNLTDGQRSEFLRIAAYRRACIDDARRGVSLTLSGLQ